MAKKKKKATKKSTVKKSQILKMPRTSNSDSYVSLYIACKDRDEALHMAQAMVEEGLCACFNLFENVTSVYKWGGELEKNTEVVLIGKTKSTLKTKAIKRAKELHSYEVPCIVAWPIDTGLNIYLEWIKNNCQE